MGCWKNFLVAVGTILLLCFGIPIHINQTTSPEVEEQFKDFQQRFNKSYDNKTVYQHRFNVFQKSVETINKLNSNRTHHLSAIYGLTKYSDMTPEEFLDKHLQSDLSDRISSRNSNESGEHKGKIHRNKRIIKNLPPKIDWREKGVVSKVNNQKLCGACWAFSTVENMESMHAIKHGETIHLSVQQLIDCAGYNNDGCNGGDACLLLEWMKHYNVKVHTEEEYPLHLKTETCKPMNDSVGGVEVNKFSCERTETRILMRRLRDTSNPFELPDALFLKLFRLNKDCVMNLIDGLQVFMAQSQRVTGIPTYLKILSALHFFGHGSYQIDVGSGFMLALSQPSVSRCIEEVSSLLTLHFSNRWISFPSTQQQKNRKKERFYEMFNFPNVIGVIDCTHVKIISPPFEHPVHPAAPYYCRKGYFSINTQIICDADYLILNMNARFPGSVHDSAIWIASTIKRHLQEQYVNGNGINYLVGDGGYPLEPWLMVPIEGAPADSPDARFNRALSRTRVIIEHVNGVLKSRFRCTFGHRALHYDPIKAAKIIYSCGILHNMSRFYNVDMPEDNNLDNNDLRDVQQEQPIVGPNNWFHEGVRVRQNIVNTYFN